MDIEFNLPEGIKQVYESSVTKDGILKSDFLPAIFCDTCFLLDFWNSSILDPSLLKLPWNEIPSHEKLWTEYLKSNKRLQQVYEIRKIVEGNLSKFHFVYTFANRLELEEVISEMRFKNNGSAVTEAKFLLKKDRKQIGDILKKVRVDYEKNPENSDLKILYWDHFHTTADIHDGLYGFIEAEINNFSITRDLFFEIGILGNLQIGFADIFHLISARNLGCKYFFTFDSDFLRGKEIIFKALQLEVITDIEEMKRILLKS